MIANRTGVRKTVVPGLQDGKVKMRDTSLSDLLRYFQTATRAPYAFQVVMELPYVEVDCFERSDPTVVPARTLLSQLL